jgi:hypothetical protein
MPASMHGISDVVKCRQPGATNLRDYVMNADKKLLFFLTESSGSIWYRRWKLSLPAPLRLQELQLKGELSVISAKPSNF